MKLIITIAFSVFCFVGFSQTKLEGTVTDAQSGEPVVFATIALYKNGILKTGAETDFEGHYSVSELELGEYEIEVSSTGYKNVKFEKAKIEKTQVYKFDVRLTSGFENYPGFGCTYIIPLITQDNTTQGHVFKNDDIRHSPSRN